MVPWAMEPGTGLQQRGGDWALSPQRGPRREKKCLLRQNSPSAESLTRRSAASSFPRGAGGRQAGRWRAHGGQQAAAPTGGHAALRGSASTAARPALCPHFVSTQGTCRWPCPLSPRLAAAGGGVVEGAGAPQKEGRALFFWAQLNAV